MLKNLNRALERKKREQDIKKKSINFSKFKIPYYNWNIKFRKIIEGHQNILQYIPLLDGLYRDEHPSIVIKWPRQLGKTTYGGGLLAYTGTQPHTKGVYVTFSDESLSSFSSDKFRGSILSSENPELYAIVKGAESGKGSVRRVEYLTGSSTSLVTDANDMHHAEGKSADILVLDECQNLNLYAYWKAKESQSWTQGRELFMGIGGYLGTEWHKLWLSSNQMKWKYHDPDWYQKILHDNRFWNDKGFVWREELIDILQGKWEAKAPKNWQVHGYTVSQMDFPNIPRTRHDAVHRYKVDEKYSLEYKREKYPSAFYRINVDADFIKGETKPFLRHMMQKLFDRTLLFTRPEDIDHSEGKIIASADWGGGSTAFTVPLNLNVGDTVPIGRNLEPLKVVDIRNIQIGGKNIDAFELSSSTINFLQGGSYEIDANDFYDKNTGILLASSFKASSSGMGETLNMDLTFNAVDFSGNLLKSNNDPLRSLISFLKSLFGLS